MKSLPWRAILPWRSWEVDDPRPLAEAFAALARSVPACDRRWTAKNSGYFCGGVRHDGTFTWHRNWPRKGRASFPVLQGKLTQRGAGTAVHLTAGPGLLFWCALAVPAIFAAFVLLGAILGLLGPPQQGQGNPLVFVLVGALGIAGTSWMWGVPILIHYISLPRFRQEFASLLTESAQPLGAIPVVRKAPKPLSHTDALKILAAFFALGGLVLGVAGLNALATGEFTYFVKEPRMRTGGYRERHPVTITGTEAKQMGAALVSAGGCGILLGTVSWIAAKAGGAKAKQPAYAYVMAAVAVVLLCCAVTFAAMSLW